MKSVLSVERCKRVLLMLESGLIGVAAAFIVITAATVVHSGLLMVE